MCQNLEGTFQDVPTPNQEGIHELYDFVMYYLAVVLGQFDNGFCILLKI